MKNKILLLVTIIICLIIFVFQGYLVVKYRSQSEDDQQFTTLVQRINFSSTQKFQKLLAHQKITLTFTAKYNNLGTVAFFFNKYQKINTDWVWFRLKEEGEKNWYYQNKYYTNEFNPDYYFPFGFPIISNSQNKTYIVEIESISGTVKNAISLHSKSTSYLAKYSFPKAFLKENPDQIIPFLSSKFRTYLGYIPKTDIVKILFKSILPILIYLFFLKKISIPTKYHHQINKILSIVYPLLVFLITFIIAGYFSTIGTDPHHDGIMFKPALDVSQGKMLFRDTFTQYGAFTTIIQSLSLKIFGEYLIVIKLTTAFFYALISLFLYLIWSKIVNHHLAFISSLILLFIAPYYLWLFLPWSSVYALFFECLTLYLFLNHLEKKNNLYIYLIGISAGLTFWCKQNVGGYIIFASLLSLILIPLLKKQNKSLIIPSIIKFIIGGILISLPFFIWIIFNGALTDWWKQSILYMFVFLDARSQTSIFNSLFPASLGPISIWTLMPILSIFIFLKESFSKKTNFTILILSIFCLFSWLQYYPVTCIRHIYWSAAPMVGLTIFLLYRLSDSIFFEKTLLKYLFLFFLLYLIFSADIYSRITNGLLKINQNYISLNTPSIIKSMKLTPPEANFYQQTSQEINDYIQKNGATNLITDGPNALYLTFAKSENFHPMYVNWGTDIYHDYAIIKDKYIIDHQPLIFTMQNHLPLGYCRFNDLVNGDNTFLVAPCSQLKHTSL